MQTKISIVIGTPKSIIVANMNTILKNIRQVCIVSKTDCMNDRHHVFSESKFFSKVSIENNRHVES